MAGRFATSSKLPRLEPSSDGLFILACTRGVNENERWHRNARCDTGRAGRRASNIKCLVVFMWLTVKLAKFHATDALRKTHAAFAMDHDYFSIDAILAENQVGALPTRLSAAA